MQLNYIIRAKYLYAVYAIVPIITLIVLIDLCLLNGSIKKVLQSSPNQTLWFIILFGAPHIVASTIAYCDKDYFQRYKMNIIWGLSGSFMLTLLTIVYLPITIGFSLLVVIGTLHLVGQQAGISRLFIRQAISNFKLWQWSTTIITCIVALSVGLSNNASSWQYIPYLPWLLILYLGFTTFLVINIVLQVQNKQQTLYLLMNQIMVIMIVVFLLMGYDLFVVLMPRLVHDSTAFIFYMVHDANRLEKSNGNLFYRVLHFKPSTILFGLPVIALGIALALNSVLPQIVILTITYFHYYIEGVAWKNGSIHRDNISIYA